MLDRPTTAGIAASTIGQMRPKRSFGASSPRRAIPVSESGVLVGCGGPRVTSCRSWAAVKVGHGLGAVHFGPYRPWLDGRRQDRGGVYVRGGKLPPEPMRSRDLPRLTTQLVRC